MAIDEMARHSDRLLRIRGLYRVGDEIGQHPVQKVRIRSDPDLVDIDLQRSGA
jgi:hypothetical protein